MGGGKIINRGDMYHEGKFVVNGQDVMIILDEILKALRKGEVITENELNKIIIKCKANAKI